jgi:ankyrin repeat protein
VGGEASVVDARGRTALHEASYGGHVAALDPLLQHWLHTATDAAGATALQWAVVAGAEAAVARLLAAAAAGGTVDSTRAQLDDLNMSVFLLSQAAGQVRYTATEQVANRNVRVWRGATENGPRTMDKSQTFASYV